MECTICEYKFQFTVVFANIHQSFRTEYHYSVFGPARNNADLQHRNSIIGSPERTTKHPHDKLLLILPPREMQTWRRAFATSVARLNHNSATTSNTRPALLRCAQILQEGKNDKCSYEDAEIQVNGFIRSVRKQKRFAFAEISDGSTIEPVQAILKPAQAAGYVLPTLSSFFEGTF